MADDTFEWVIDASAQAQRYNAVREEVRSALDTRDRYPLARLIMVTGVVGNKDDEIRARGDLVIQGGRVVNEGPELEAAYGGQEPVVAAFPSTIAGKFTLSERGFRLEFEAEHALHLTIPAVAQLGVDR